MPKMATTPRALRDQLQRVGHFAVGWFGDLENTSQAPGELDRAGSTEGFGRADPHEVT